MRTAIVVLSVCLAGVSLVVAHTALRQRTGLPAVVENAAEDVDLPLMGDFQFTERSGRRVTRDDLKGKVWIASFVFTQCTTQCPQIFATMTRLQTELAGEPNVRLVSFTVDPERDTPEVLKKHACACQAADDRWLFLTGDRDKLYGFIEKGFHLTVQANEGADRKPGNEVLHDFRLAVVDAHGHVRGYFDGRNTDEQGQPIDAVPRLKAKVAALVREAEAP